ncbi:tetraacyldisaccharide 4'-kinase [Desulfonatronospira sp.]|uniref:tetraacyldisaccharide 4'-kinase n=1 Tax=Desulfonatronospira sp. TaxID=1962951 RepID=UPI0025C2DEDB|nr:tetraacyldisaccharide 4'-kinase [Desulfonatronospira sp.]
MPEWLPESGLLKNAGDRAVRAASLIYARGMRLRQYYLLRRAWTAPVPVVSVGNISMGGSGKTPVCAFLLKHLLAWDQRPVLLSRGYKARPPQYPYPVHPLDDPGCCGDEPLMLAQIPGRLRVVVDPSRKRAAGWAVKHLSPTVFVLDDGFQHMHLHRDLDLVLLTVRDLQEDWDRVVPRGRWREGAKALQRADLFLVNTRDKSLDELKSLADGRLRDFKKPVFFFKVEINSLQRLGDNKSTYNIQGRPYLLISAVAGPEKIFASASGFLGYPPEKHLVLPDHHPLGPGTAGKIFHLARKMGVKDVLCTTKDAVKLKPQAGLNFWTMQTGLLFAESGEEIFLDVVRHACSGIKKTGTA